MNLSRTLRVAACAAALMVIVSPAGYGAPAKVFEDPADDAGIASQGIALPPASSAGFDLVGGTVVRKGGNLEFTVTHSAMPSSGTLPEGFRFLWHFTVGPKEYRFTIKSADVGKPDVIAQTGTERVGQVDTDGHFRLEECYIEATPAIQLSQCKPVAYLDGRFDPAKASFTAIVPLKAVKAKPGMAISGGTGGASSTGCQICWLPHYAERSLTPHTIIDSAAQTGSYKIPR